MKRDEVLMLEQNLMKIWVYLNHNSFNLSCNGDDEKLHDLIKSYPTEHQKQK